MKLIKNFLDYFKTVFELDTLAYILICIMVPWSVLQVANIYPGDKVTMVFMFVIIAMYFACVILICPILETNRQLKNILRESKKCKDFKALSDIIKQKKNYKIRGAFIEFEKNTKRVVTEDNKSRVYASVDSGYYIDEDSLVYSDLKTKTIDQLTQSFTGVGIFGTFLGIVRGVSSLNVEDAAAMKDGIATLLSGVKVSFNSSLYGILASVIIIIVYKILLDITNSKIVKLNIEINSMVLPDNSSETLDFNLKNDIDSLKLQINSLRNANEKLMGLLESKEV